MVEKFSDYESVGFIGKEGSFVFTVKEAELKQSSKGDDMVELQVESDEGKTTLRHSLLPKARWSYNNLIKACLNLDTKDKIYSFECDYQTVHQQLIGKKFLGKVECQPYDKIVKVPQDDGTFMESVEKRDSYKIVSYDFVR